MDGGFAPVQGLADWYISHHTQSFFFRGVGGGVACSYLTYIFQFTPKCRCYQFEKKNIWIILKCREGFQVLKDTEQSQRHARFTVGIPASIMGKECLIQTSCIVTGYFFFRRHSRASFITLRLTCVSICINFKLLNEQPLSLGGWQHAINGVI